MSRKPLFVITLFCLALAGLACNVGASAGNSAAESQALLAQIPKHFSDDPQADQTYIGSVEGSQAYIAFVIQGDTAVVYICDGDKLSEWISGKVADSQLEFASEKGTQLKANITADSVAGTLTLPDGQPLAFSASPAVEGQTGLYRYQGDENGVTYTTGWIVGPAGARGETNSVNGAQNGVIVNVNPGEGTQTALRIQSDSNEYAIAFQGVGYNLHAFSVLQLAVSSGQNDFDYFCHSTKYFAGGIQVPEGSTLIVNLVADGCQAVASAPQAAPEPSSGSSNADGTASNGSNNGSFASNGGGSSGAGCGFGFGGGFCFQPGLGGFGGQFGGQFGGGFGGSQFGGFGGFGP